MTDDTMALCGLLEKSSDADRLREMIGFAAERVMVLEVAGQTGAGHRERSESRMNQRRPVPSEACWIEAIGRLRQQVVDVALQDGLQQMMVDADLGRNQAGDTSWPVQ